MIKNGTPDWSTRYRWEASALRGKLNAGEESGSNAPKDSSSANLIPGIFLIFVFMAQRVGGMISRTLSGVTPSGVHPLVSFL
jgi:hypothetical protein